MYSIADELDIKRFEKLIGNRFKAVIYISKLARHRRELVHCVITESQAITWVISGIKPEGLYDCINNHLKLKNGVVLPPYDRLQYIDDKELVECVKLSVKYSKITHLVYIYNEITDKNKQSRIRILTNMIVDELHKEMLEDVIWKY